MALYTAESYYKRLKRRIYIDCSNGLVQIGVTALDLGASEKEIAEQVELLGKFPCIEDTWKLKN